MMHVDPRHSIYRACRYSIGDKLTVPPERAQVRAVQRAY
jgi:hypothetical protein